MVVYLYAALSLHLQLAGLAEPAVVHANVQRNGELLHRLMSVGCRVVRHLCLMVYGEYVPPDNYVYCPSLIG